MAIFPVDVSACLLLLLMTIANHLEVVVACSCLPQHTQQHFCNSHFVIKARVKSEKMAVKKGFDAHNLQKLPLPVLTSAQRSYKLWVREVFKGHQFIAVGSHPEIVTSYYESMCGVSDLKIGKTYVIMGMLTDTKLKFTNCNWREPWTQISKHQRRGLKYWYEKNCNSCQIDTCGRFSPCGQQEKDRVEQGDSCTWDPMDGQCQNLHSSCFKHDGGSCKWFQTAELLARHNCTQAHRTPMHNNAIPSM